MDAVKFFKELKRMCNIKDCLNCPMNYKNSGNHAPCIIRLYEDPAEAVAIVEKWAAEHPQKTIMQDFFEKFPNAPKDNDGIPKCCPCHCGYEQHGDCLNMSGCFDCWNRPLEDFD